MKCTHGGNNDRDDGMYEVIASSVIIGDLLTVVTIISSRCIIMPL
ncbi:hypothetical protein [Chamaesiphon sp. OTE_20_metabat_361]|nr:hypothetical protein [Chamaesiphon sp. OTE_20_metabat_361]